MSKAKEMIKVIVKIVEIANKLLVGYIVPYFPVVIMAILAIVANGGA